MLLLSGLFLAGGFVYAGGQHFAALRYGYQTEDLRKVRDQLIEERHRFLLAREEAASPMRLERAARELGLQPLQAAQIDPLRRASTNTPAKPAAQIEISLPRKPAAAPAPRISEKKVALKFPIPSKASMAAKAPARESRKKPI
jgi:hypothetical protein